MPPVHPIMLLNSNQFNMATESVKSSITFGYFAWGTPGLSQAAPLRQSRTTKKNGQGDNLSPSKFRGKTGKEAHTKRFISVQKLQAETEHGKYILSHL